MASPSRDAEAIAPQPGIFARFAVVDVLVDFKQKSACEETGVGAQKLLATDWMFSPLSVHTVSNVQAVVYSVYGHRAAIESLPMTGFTGQRFEPGLKGYLLGNGHRAFNPALMRFHSPDQLSPFDDGGINAYAYCAGNPVNRRDPSGQTAVTVVGHVFGYSASTMTSVGAFNRVADQVVKKRINPGGVEPTLLNKWGNTLQFWGGFFGDVGRSVLLQKGLADAPTGAEDISTYVAQTASSMGIAGGGALLTQPMVTGWVAKAKENKLSVLGVVAETFYEVSGTAMVVEGAQAAASLVARGAQAAAGLVVGGVRALYTGPVVGEIRGAA
ncbi:RHS repeat-associated core domain-containing protein [Pseudomonas sp. TE50-2]|uniref:RHS repeat-associated core domain-containing protein n=1 Tax=Pseudomonas sp. TE50-2 TaxID=3142707 RepID=UPI003467BC9C